MKWLLISGGSLLLIGVIVYFYFATRTHEDTANLKVDYNVEAIPFIKEFEKDLLQPIHLFLLIVTGEVSPLFLTYQPRYVCILILC